MNKKAFKKCLKFFIHSFTLIYIILGGIRHLSAQDDNIKAGKKLFNANCAACHKLNKRAVGPALKGVSAKYDKEWLYSWIKNSTAMVKSGDAQAVAIYEEYNKSVMTSFPQLSNEDIDNIIAYTDFIPVEINFETPNYKVQAGYYKDKLIGIKTLDTVKKVFPSAFLLLKKDL